MLYARSARSLSRSPLPMAGSWVTHSRQTPPLSEPLLGARSQMQSAPVTKNMLSVVSYNILIFKKNLWMKIP